MLDQLSIHKTVLLKIFYNIFYFIKELNLLFLLVNF